MVKPMKNFGFAILFSFVLAGCATAANYEKLLNGFVGFHMDELVMKWGPPEKSYALSNGGKVLEYSKQRNIQLGGQATTVPVTTHESGTANVFGNRSSAYGTYFSTSTTHVPTTTPVTNFTLQCITRFTVDEKGIIRKWATQGNDCKAAEPR